MTSSRKHGGRRDPPHAFTEQSVAMLSSVLRSRRGAAAYFLASRGGPGSTRIGAEKVRTWDRQLARGSAALDRRAAPALQSQSS